VPTYLALHALPSESVATGGVTSRGGGSRSDLRPSKGSLISSMRTWTRSPFRPPRPSSWQPQRARVRHRRALHAGNSRTSARAAARGATRRASADHLEHVSRGDLRRARAAVTRAVSCRWRALTLAERPPPVSDIHRRASDRVRAGREPRYGARRVSPWLSRLRCKLRSSHPRGAARCNPRSRPRTRSRRSRGTSPLSPDRSRSQLWDLHRTGHRPAVGANAEALLVILGAHFTPAQPAPSVWADAGEAV